MLRSRPLFTSWRPNLSLGPVDSSRFRKHWLRHKSLVNIQSFWWCRTFVLAELARAGVLDNVPKICCANEASKWNWYTLNGALPASMYWAPVNRQKWAKSLSLPILHPSTADNLLLSRSLQGSGRGSDNQETNRTCLGWPGAGRKGEQIESH